MSLQDASAPALRKKSPLPDAAHACAAGQPAPRHQLRDRFLRAGHEAVDDRELLELLLSASHSEAEARSLASILLDTFGTPARVLAARPDRLRTVARLGEAAICAIKTAEALGIRLARAALPDSFHPQLDTYRKVIDYCRALAAHNDVEELRLLFLDTKNRLIREELQQRGTVDHTSAYPREICIRCLEIGARAVIVFHNHPGGNATPSRADVAMTNTVRDALKLIGVDVHDHIVVAPGDAFSFKQRGLL